MIIEMQSCLTVNCLPEGSYQPPNDMVQGDRVQGSSEGEILKVGESQRGEIPNSVQVTG